MLVEEGQERGEGEERRGGGEEETGRKGVERKG